jgi:hypothetical protein
MSFLINPYRFGVPDPNFSSVSLLLHGDGTNGSTTITDSSPSPKTVTAVGNAQVSTAQSKYGGASIAFDGTGDYLELATTTDFAFSGDFTVESWVYFSTAPTGVNAAWVIDFRIGSTNHLVAGIYSSSPKIICGLNALSSIGTTTLTASTWHHLAWVRSGSTITSYVNGVSDGTFSTSYSQPATALVIGSRYTKVTEFLNGYIDELRITKGVARYTANFTPPTAPFPNS